MTLKFKNKLYGRLYSLSQVVLDILISYGILCAVTYIYYLCGAKYEMTICFKLLVLPFLIAIINTASRVYGRNLFYPGLGINRVEDLKRSTLSIVASYVILFAYLGVTRTAEEYSRLVLGVSVVLSVLAIPVGRNLFKYLCRKCSCCSQPLLIAGAGEQGRFLAKRLADDWYFNVRIVGFLDDNAEEEDVLGKLSDAEEVSEKYGVNYLIICLPEEVQKKYLRSFLKNFCHILLVPSTGLYAVCSSYPVSIARNWAFEVGNKLQMKLYRCEKNILEFCLAVVMVPLLFPFCVFIALLVKITSSGPIFYRARRLGLHGKEITVLKFRTMYKNSDQVLQDMLNENPELQKEWEERFKLKDDPRITPLGRFLRKTSLDELPQFINVLRGEMSIIGPRPIVTAEIDYYGEDFHIFSMVKPGITGLWQISGRSDVDYETRVKMDVYYVANWSIWLDYYIFLNTFVAVLFRRGAE